MRERLKAVVQNLQQTETGEFQTKYQKLEEIAEHSMCKFTHSFCKMPEKCSAEMNINFEVLLMIAFYRQVLLLCTLGEGLDYYYFVCTILAKSNGEILRNADLRKPPLLSCDCEKSTPACE